jgi:hypothetical protein
VGPSTTAASRASGSHCVRSGLLDLPVSELSAGNQQRWSEPALKNGLSVLWLSTTISATNVRGSPLRAFGLPLVSLHRSAAAEPPIWIGRRAPQRPEARLLIGRDPAVLRPPPIPGLAGDRHDAAGRQRYFAGANGSPTEWPVGDPFALSSGAGSSPATAHRKMRSHRVFSPATSLDVPDDHHAGSPSHSPPGTRAEHERLCSP